MYAPGADWVLSASSVTWNCAQSLVAVRSPAGIGVLVGRGEEEGKGVAVGLRAGTAEQAVRSSDTMENRAEKEVFCFFIFQLLGQCPKACRLFSLISLISIQAGGLGT